MEDGHHLALGSGALLGLLEDVRRRPWPHPSSFPTRASSRMRGRDRPKRETRKEKNHVTLAADVISSSSLLAIIPLPTMAKTEPGLLKASTQLFYLL